eukprot:543209-Alexandrium_andersonii.AAC.1
MPATRVDEPRLHGVLLPCRGSRTTSALFLEMSAPGAVSFGDCLVGRQLGRGHLSPARDRRLAAG